MSGETASAAKELSEMIANVERLKIINIISKYERAILEDALDTKDSIGMYVAGKQCDALDKIKQKINALSLE